MKAFVLGLITVVGIVTLAIAAGGAPNYVPNPATMISGAAMTGDVTGTIGANTVISATTAQLTASTMTVSSNALVREVITKYSWTNAMVAALGAVTAGDVQIATIPANCEIRRVTIVLDSQAAGTTTLTIAVGRTGAAFNDYVVVSDCQQAANTVYGDTKTTIGTNLYDGVTLRPDVPSITATTPLKAHFISTGANLSAVTTCTGHIYVTSVLRP